MTRKRKGETKKMDKSKLRMMARKVVKSRMTRARTMMKMRHNVKMPLQQTLMNNPTYLQEDGAEVEVEEGVADVDADEVVVQVLVLGDQEADQEAVDVVVDVDEGEVQAQH